MIVQDASCTHEDFRLHTLGVNLNAHNRRREHGHSITADGRIEGAKVMFYGRHLNALHQLSGSTKLSLFDASVHDGAFEE
jgi:hypothetical protein